MIGDYGVSFEPDLPIYLTTELLFFEIVDPQRSIMRVNTIFHNRETDEDPSWFIMFSMPNCHHCTEVKPEIHRLAAHYHSQENAGLNFRVAEVDCTNEAAEDICMYFGHNKLPKFTVLDPATDSFYMYPTKSPRLFEQFVEFSQGGFSESFVQGEIPRTYEGWDLTYRQMRYQF